MEKSNCIFCKIIKKAVPATVIKEYDDIIVINDVAPKAPIHYLIIPKEHIADIRFLPDKNLAGSLLMVAQDLSKNNHLPTSDFKLVVNNGARAGQHVFHLHMHFLAGSVMSDF